MIEPSELPGDRVEGVSRAEVAALDAEIAATAARRRTRARRRLVVAVFVAVFVAAGAVWGAFAALAAWERSVATRSALAAAAEIRASAVGSGVLPSPVAVDGVGGVAAVTPEVSPSAPERVGELGYVVSEDRRSAALVAASRTACVTVTFSVNSPPTVVSVSQRDGACALTDPREP